MDIILENSDVITSRSQIAEQTKSKNQVEEKKRLKRINLFFLIKGIRKIRKTRFGNRPNC